MASAWGNAWDVNWGNSWGTITVAVADAPVVVPRATGGWFPEIFGYEKKRKHVARTIVELELVFKPFAIARKVAAARCIEQDQVFAARATAGGVKCRAWPVMPAFIDCNRARGRYFPGEAEALLALFGLKETQ